jgi:UDP-GlcNAc:undecaprenyl-phosphate GlcNAc-1-phosphate transferase
LRVIALVALALPAALSATWLLLRSPLAVRLVADPRADRWHVQQTPLLGGIGIFAGFLVGIGAATAAGAISDHRELWGIVGGCALLFLAGLVDDLWNLPPLVKIAAQIGAAAIVLSAGLKVQIVSNSVLATAIAIVWLVGMTNAFNLLDNMDGLAATLAVIAAACFAVDAVTVHKSHLTLAIALALALGCLGFLPFNLRPSRPAATFMGDSGSQVLGFALASLGLASSWKVAGSTVAALLLPLLILAVPILDTTLVTIVRLLEGRPIYQGGRDHTSHRLVSRGLSDRRAVVLLAVVSAGLGATSLAYTTIDDQRVTVIGVLLTFAALVQFASFLSEIDRNAEAPAGVLGALLAHRRRLVEVLVDFALISVAFVAAYFLVVGDTGSTFLKHFATIALPTILFARYATFIPFGLYRGVWRYAGARDALSVAVAVIVSEAIAYGFLAATQRFGTFPRSVFVVDALLSMLLVGASRFGERALDRGLSGLRDRSSRKRTLIVGAGRNGRSLLRELRETPGIRVVGLVDDEPALRGRRLQGTPVVGNLDEIGYAIGRTAPDEVLVTIPDAPRIRLDAVLEACERASVPCRFVRREIDVDPRVTLRAVAE